MKSRRKRCMEMVLYEYMGQTRNACRILVEKTRARNRYRWEDNIKKGLREVRYKDVDQISNSG
jgi:hypothetical protein